MEFVDQNPSGIVVSEVFSGGLIENNQISSDFFGIVLNGQSNIEIRNNVVYTSITAMMLKDAPNVVVRGNILSAKASIYPGPVNGIALMGSFSGGLIENNRDQLGTIWHLFLRPIEYQCKKQHNLLIRTWNRRLRHLGCIYKKQCHSRQPGNHHRRTTGRYSAEHHNHGQHRSWRTGQESV